MVRQTGFHNVVDRLLWHQICSLDLDVIKASEDIWSEFISDPLMVGFAIDKLCLDLHRRNVFIVLPAWYGSRMGVQSKKIN